MNSTADRIAARYVTAMDRWIEQILAAFEARIDDLAREIAVSAVDDANLPGEEAAVWHRHLEAFARAVRTGGPPDPVVLTAARERAARHAREMVPLSTILHTYLIAQRVILAAVGSAAGERAQSRGAALVLTASTFNYNIAVTSAVAEAYVEVVQGNLAELESARCSLVDTVLTANDASLVALTRRAIGLGFDPQHSYTVAVAVVETSADRHPRIDAPRWAAQAIARASGRPEHHAFVVIRMREIVALLDANGRHAARAVLESAAETMKQSHSTRLRAGIGTPFAGLAGFAVSFQEARRALRHTSSARPFVVGPKEVRLFDELTAVLAEDGEPIPENTRIALAYPGMQATIEAFMQADMNVANAANRLCLHPNSLRYRLRRIAEKTGRDPRKLADLFELIAAGRVMASVVSR